MTWWRRLIKQGGFLLALLLAVPLAFNAFSYINFDPQYNFLSLKQRAIATGWYLPAYYSHVLVAGVILLIGFFQLHPRWGRRWYPVHRVLGKIYVGGILFFSAPGGMIMSFFINRGPYVLTSFLLQCTAWMVCTYLAYVKIREGNVFAHQQWMWRSFSLTLAAITLRVYVFISSWSFDLAQPESYATIAWLSWVPNLLLVEWYIHRKSRVDKLHQIQ